MWKCVKCGENNEGNFCAYCGLACPVDCEATIDNYYPPEPNTAELPTGVYNQNSKETDDGYNKLPDEPMDKYYTPENNYIHEYVEPVVVSSYTPNPSKKKNSSSVVLWIICIVLALVLAGLVGYSAYLLMNFHNATISTGIHSFRLV